MSLISGICLNGYMFCNCHNWRSSFLIIFVCKWKWRLFVQKYVSFVPCGKNRRWHNLPWKFAARFSSCSCLGHRQAARRILMSPLWCCRTLLLGALHVLQKKSQGFHLDVKSLEKSPYFNISFSNRKQAESLCRHPFCRSLSCVRLASTGTATWCGDTNTSVEAQTKRMPTHDCPTLQIVQVAIDFAAGCNEIQ